MRLHLVIRAKRATCALVLAVGTVGTSSQAFADPTSDQCVDANSQAQLSRRNGRLGTAREQLRSCADARCPSMVRDDCAQRLDEVNRMQPTIVFDAKDGAGNDVVAAAVTVDGHALADKLDGSPLSVDPGAHTFQFSVAGQPPVVRAFVLKEGEKGRVERVVLGPAPAPPPRAPAPAAATEVVPPPPPESHGLGAGKVSGLVIAALGLGGIAAGTAYGLLAKSAWDRSQGECNANCPESTRPQAVSDWHVAVTDSTVSTAGFIAGGVLFAGGIAILCGVAVAADARAGGRSSNDSGVRTGLGGARSQGEF